MSSKQAERAEITQKLETLREAEAPNQLALELLKRADDIGELVVILRDKTGKLHAFWTDQDLATVAECALYLSALLQHDLYLEHEASPDEEDDPCEA